jgi:hypothetical protein
MSEAAAVTGHVTGISATKDGGLKITMEIGEYEVSKFHLGFRMHTPIALVRMIDDSGATSGTDTSTD